MEILIGLGLKLLPFLAVLGAVIWGYFQIKSKGAEAEREKWEKAQAEERETVRRQLDEAIRGDAEIDRGVYEKLDQIKSKEVADRERNSATDPDSRFRF